MTVRAVSQTGSVRWSGKPAFPWSGPFEFVRRAGQVIAESNLRRSARIEILFLEGVDASH